MDASDLLDFVVAEVEMLQTRALVKTAHPFDLVRAQPESFQKFAFVYTLQSTTVKLANTCLYLLTSISVTELLTMVSSLRPVK